MLDNNTATVQFKKFNNDNKESDDEVRTEALITLTKITHEHVMEIRALKKDFQEFEKFLKKQEKNLEKQQEVVQKQKEDLEEMITQQGLTDRSLKILKGLLIGAVLGIILLIAGIVYDLIRDNRLYEMYIDKTDKIQEQFLETNLNIINSEKNSLIKEYD